MASLWTIRNQTRQRLASDEIDNAGKIAQRVISPSEAFNILSTAVGPVMSRQIENGLLSIENQSDPPDPALIVFQPRDRVRVATTADVGGVYDAEGGSAGSGSFAGASTTVDGVSLLDGDRILVKDQGDARQNGIYSVVIAATGDWERAGDMDASVEALSGLAVQASEGTTNANTQWACISPNPVVLNTNEVNWVLFSVALAPDAVTIRDRLETLGGADRLDASAIQNLPDGGGGGGSAFAANIASATTHDNTGPSNDISIPSSAWNDVDLAIIPITSQNATLGTPGSPIVVDFDAAPATARNGCRIRITIEDAFTGDVSAVEAIEVQCNAAGLTLLNPDAFFLLAESAPNSPTAVQIDAVYASEGGTTGIFVENVMQTYATNPLGFDLG